MEDKHYWGILPGESSFKHRLEKIIFQSGLNELSQINPYVDEPNSALDILFVDSSIFIQEVVRLKEKEAYGYAVLLAYADVYDDQYFQLAYKAGFKDFLHDGLSDAELETRIRSALHHNENIQKLNMELDMTNSSMDQMEGAMLQFESMSLEISILNDNLEEEISERKKVEKELRDREVQLKDAIATKDRFFSIIAHDLKNPFNALIGLSDILLHEFDSYDDNQKKTLINDMKAASENTFHLLQELLEWSRSQMGHIDKKPSVLNTEELVEKAVAPLRQHAENKKISLLVDVASPSKVFANENMISTVIRNLCSNGLKFTKPNGVVVVMAQEKQSKVEFSIKDTGIGIAEKNISKLFRIDEQYKTKGTANETGTGLGLILCKEFVEQNMGEIWVESELGKGSEFKFVLPKPVN